MKLRKLVNNIVFSQEINDYLKSLDPFKQKHWKLQTNDMKSFKTFLRRELEVVQDNKCAYCGFLLNITSGSEIEHIAPKADKLYPMFMFERENLVLSCHLCNGRSNKGEQNTISMYNSTYRNCEFTIVHPYYDDPDEHYDYLPSSGDETIKIIIICKTDKALQSEEMFDLNHEAKVTERAKQSIFNELRLTINNSSLNELLHKSLLHKSHK